MPKGDFTAGWKQEKDKRNKGIQVKAENDTEGMVIIRDETHIISVTGKTGETNDPKKDLGIDFNNPPPDTVIFTHTNPTCGYYYFGGKWWYR